MNKIKPGFFILFSVILINTGCTKTEVTQNQTAIETAQNTKKEDKYTFISPSSMTLSKGQMFKFNAKIQLKDGTLSKNIMWSTTNPYVIQMGYDGWVTAMNEGYASITATAREDYSRQAHGSANVVKYDESSKK